jgi:hypothetical protein
MHSLQWETGSLAVPVGLVARSLIRSIFCITSFMPQVSLVLAEWAPIEVATLKDLLVKEAHAAQLAIDSPKFIDMYYRYYSLNVFFSNSNTTAFPQIVASLDCNSIHAASFIPWVNPMVNVDNRRHGWQAALRKLQPRPV